MCSMQANTQEVLAQIFCRVKNGLEEVKGTGKYKSRHKTPNSFYESQKNLQSLQRKVSRTAPMGQNKYQRTLKCR